MNKNTVKLQKLHFGNLNEGEIIIECLLLFTPNIKSYEKKLGRFTEETRTYREVLNSPFEILIDYENLVQLERYNSDAMAFQLSKGESPDNLYRMKKCFYKETHQEIPFSTSDIFLERNDTNELLFIIEIK